MHIFRWLMYHPIITAWILAALAILLNLNMGGNGHKGVEHAEAEVGHEVIESNKHEALLDNHQGSAEVGSANQIQGVETLGNVAGDSTSVAQSKAMVETGSPAGDASIADSTQAGVSTDEGIEGLASMSSHELLQLAREAFWQNKKEKSVAIYQALIKREPSSLVHKGELANVFWHQNKQKESAALYAEIAIPLIEAGKTNEVSNMLGFISVFFPEKSLELQKLISK